MYLKFNSIELEGFMSLGKVLINLSDQGNIIVKGINRYDDATSNGSGKSSIFEGIIWALTGSLSRGSVAVNDVINKNYKNYCLVTLKFEYDNNKVELTRTRKHPQLGSTLILKINDKDVSKKTASMTSKYLLEMIPQLTTTVISSIIILGQGLPNSFSSMTSSSRKDYLETITQLNSEIYKLTEFYKSYLAKIGTEITKYIEDIASSRGQLSILNNSITDYTFKIDKADRVIKEVQESSDTSRLNELKNLISTYTDDLKELEKSKTWYSDALATSKNDLTTINNKISIIQNYELPKYDIEEICPTCGQRVPESKLLESANNKSILLQKLEDLLSLKSEYKDICTEYSDNYQQEVTKSAELLSRLDQAQKEVSQLELSLDITKWEADISTYTSLKKDAESQVGILNENIKSLETESDSLNSYKSKIAKMSRAVNKDFKSYMLEDIIQYLNEKLSYYSNFITPSAKVKIVQSSGKIEIYKDSSTYESLSGGERRRLDIIIQLSMRDMMSTITNFHCNLLVLDEIFDNLDKDGCDRLIKLLYTQFNEIDSLYVVTHRVDLDLQGDQELVVVKNEMGISELQSLGGLIC